MKEYDYLIVGAGLYGSVFARQMTDTGKRCLVIDRRNHFGGNIHCETIEGIQVHRYGAHIFHTSDREVWAYVNRYAEYEQYSALAAKESNVIFGGRLGSYRYYDMDKVIQAALDCSRLNTTRTLFESV